jgi:hypothetical protein
MHKGINLKKHNDLTLPLKLVTEPATILFSRVLASRGSQVPLITLHEETELVSGSWLLLTSEKLHFAIHH